MFDFMPEIEALKDIKNAQIKPILRGGIAELLEFLFPEHKKQESLGDASEKPYFRA